MAIMHDKIKELRNEKGLTLYQIAERLGVTEATAQRYETGKGIKTIPYDMIERYANIFNCSPSYIMGWDIKKEIEEKPEETGAMVGKALKNDNFLRLLSLFEKLDDEGKKDAIKHLEYLVYKCQGKAP